MNLLYFKRNIMLSHPIIERYNKQLLQRFQDSQSSMFTDGFMDSEFIKIFEKPKLLKDKEC
jgi:hypothetical protein